MNELGESCVGDEGRPFGVGDPPRAPNHCKRRGSKARVVSVTEKARYDVSGVRQEGERKRTTDDVSIA